MSLSVCDLRVSSKPLSPQESTYFSSAGYTRRRMFKKVYAKTFGFILIKILLSQPLSVFRLYFSVRKLILHETSHLTTDDAVDIDSLTLIRWTLFYKIRSYIHLASFSTTSFNRCAAMSLINLVGKG